METYPWEEFYPEHCTTDFIDEMIAEDVVLELNEDISDWDFSDAMSELSVYKYQKWLLEQLVDAGLILHASYIKEIYDQEGECDLLYEMISLYKGSFSEVFIKDVIDAWDGGLLDLIFPRYDGSVSVQDLIEIVNSGVSDSTLELAFIKCDNKEKATAEQIIDLLDNCDRHFYPYIQKMMKGLSFRDRVRIRDEYF